MLTGIITNNNGHGHCFNQSNYSLKIHVLGSIEQKALQEIESLLVANQI